MSEKSTLAVPVRVENRDGYMVAVLVVAPGQQFDIASVVGGACDASDDVLDAFKNLVALVVRTMVREGTGDANATVTAQTEVPLASGGLH